MTTTLRITREDETTYTVHTNTPAELLAYCLCAEQHVTADTVVCSGITTDDTPLLQQALAAIANGRGEWVYVTSDVAQVDGAR